MTITIKLHKLRWRYHNPTKLESSEIILENTDNHVDSLLISIGADNSEIKRYVIRSLGTLEKLDKESEILVLRAIKS